MQRSVLVALLLLLSALVGAGWWWLRGDAALPAPAPGPAAPVAATSDAATTAPPPVTDATANASRQAVAIADPGLLDDPEIRAALCGFKGRVVTHDKKPVADRGVRIYRGAMDSVIPTTADLFAAESAHTPTYIAGETKTATDGKWQLTGVWPRAFYLLFAGIGTDAPVHQVITRSPSPGEIVDLGDIVLPDAGVIVGTVVDDNGDPMAGALVRAADVPGTLAALFPIERIDPEGALLIRDSGAPMRVVLAPPWVKSAWEHLPIPTTRSGPDGAFRLVGVVPGSNMLATTQKEFLSDVKPSVQVRAGQEKDVGTIKMKRGEELTGKVVDTAGKPVADAEVLAGSTLSLAPVDIAQKVGKTNPEGRFTGQGFAGGKVTVAARRGKGHAWVLAEPQPILGDVVVTLPSSFAVEATVTLADGKPAKTTRMQLLQGRAGNGAAEMTLFGMVPPVDLTDRKKEVAEGRWRIENLNAGSYTLLADAPGHATAFVVFDITDADTTVTLALTAPVVFAVRVLTTDGKPVRNAAIYAEARGKNVVEMPMLCGRTKPDGTLAIDSMVGETLRVSAEHPRWGVVHGEAKLAEELVLRMQPPGTLRGVLLENGKPPEPGKFTVALEHRRSGDEPRGPIETVPMLLTPALDGTFAVASLQPGTYRAEPIKALDALRSPGGVFAMAQDAFMTNGMQGAEARIVSGQTTEITVEAGQKPIEGPTARLGGSVTIDGRLGAGSIVNAHAEHRRFSARVDERGRFDLGIVPAGDLWLGVTASGDGMLFGPDNNIWSSQLKLVADETRELTIEVQTTSLRGNCYGPDGSPVAGVFVQGNGRLKGADPQRGNVWISTTTDAEGQFHFAQVAEGTWSLSVRSRDQQHLRGQLQGIEAAGGVPVTGLRIALEPAMVVKGTVDLAALGAKKPQWAWLSFHRLKENDAPTAEGEWADGVSIDLHDGAFTTDDLTPGRYRLQLHAATDDRQGAEYPCDVLMVPPAGLAGITVRPGPRKQR
ncbi:MAG: carboxypeptidase-like regulatory domain-containing protein [Planctomycetota bacterium]